ncbi:hypothetical protein Vadar_019897 [Vaccinium darrowii]|uniref:Uncharacterized protein n=1 Tax=Vaccinium darrowii TaxID=229202 RepID=A0ACB7Y1Z5_9ERIC|nr:hypothetical protein Vadar_019897 [Vaccinium darrowii]
MLLKEEIAVGDKKDPSLLTKVSIDDDQDSTNVADAWKMRSSPQSYYHIALHQSSVLLDHLEEHILATPQSDVYAFGVVLLEIVCGLRPGTSINEYYCSIDWVWSLHREGRILDAVEKRLANEYVVEEAQKVLVLALACCHPIARERPKTQAIVQILSGLVYVPYVPPFKPAFVGPSMPSMEEDDSCTMETRSYQTSQLRSDFIPQCINRELCASDKFNTV